MYDSFSVNIHIHYFNNEKRVEGVDFLIWYTVNSPGFWIRIKIHISVDQP